MSPFPGYVELACQACARTFNVDFVDLDIDEIGLEERDMGSEVFYSGQADFYCPNCQAPIQVSCDASEYPTEALNYFEASATGATVVRQVTSFPEFREQLLYSIPEDERSPASRQARLITGQLSVVVFKLLEKVRVTPADLLSLTPREFEELIAHVFSVNGFKVDLTKRTRDGGRDIVAIRSDLDIKCKYIIECKRYTPPRDVGVGLVRALHGVQMQEGANKAILATTSRFTSDARTFAEAATTAWAMDLKDVDDICKWLTQKSMTWRR